MAQPAGVVRRTFLPLLLSLILLLSVPAAPAGAGEGTARSAGAGFALPARNAPVSAERVSNLAVAFVYVGAPNLEASLDRAVQAGVRRVQVVASWQAICPQRDGCDFAVLDRYFAAAKARGLSTLIHINSTPDWVHPELAATVPNYGERIWYPPTADAQQLADFSSFVTTLAGRYRGRVESYEIWNEENWRDFYRPVENAADYVKLLRAAYLAVKSADPRALVMFGGTTRTDPGFLRDAYAAAAAYPGARAHRYFFDVMGAHPYTDDRAPDNIDPAKVRENAAGGEFDDNFLGIDRVHAEMVRHGDGDKPIHLGEFSYSAVPSWMGLVPDDRRASYLRRAYELAAQRPYISGLAWFLWSESAPNDDWHGWTLLEYPDKPTRSYQALAELTGAARRPLVPALAASCSGSACTASAPNVPATEIERAELYVEGAQVASGDRLPLAWDKATIPAGATKLVQLVVYTTSGKTLQSKPVFFANGAQTTQLLKATVKATRPALVMTGVRAAGPITLHVTDSSGAIVRTVALGVGTGRWTRFDALVALDLPGTYHLTARDRRGRAVAAPAELVVVSQ